MNATNVDLKKARKAHRSLIFGLEAMTEKDKREAAGMVKSELDKAYLTAGDIWQKKLILDLLLDSQARAGRLINEKFTTEGASIFTGYDQLEVSSAGKKSYDFPS